MNETLQVLDDEELRVLEGLIGNDGLGELYDLFCCSSSAPFPLNCPQWMSFQWGFNGGWAQAPP